MTQATETLPNAFIGKPGMPTDDDLAAELGRSAKALWDRLLAGLAERHNIVTREWNSYSPKAGWSLRLKRDKRTILYLSPCRGCFRASFALGGKAVEAARARRRRVDPALERERVGELELRRVGQFDLVGRVVDVLIGEDIGI